MTYTTENLQTGKIAYFGLQKTLVFCLKNGLIDIEKYVTSNSRSTLLLSAVFNIDGLPLYKSSGLNMWPILMKIDSVFRPMPVAVFLGNGKPILSKFLEKLVGELKTITSFGLVCGSYIVKFAKILFVCDAPAKSYICEIMGHTSKNGCPYCNSVGKLVDRRVVYSTIVGENVQTKIMLGV